jgi:hypothetical protein
VFVAVVSLILGAWFVVVTVRNTNAIVHQVQGLQQQRNIELNGIAKDYNAIVADGNGIDADTRLIQLNYATIVAICRSTPGCVLPTDVTP